MADWCDKCERDAAYQDDPDADGSLGCPILAKSFMYNIDDPQYPQEWIYEEIIASDGLPVPIPSCTAFVERGKPIPLEPDTMSGDLFDATRRKP